jgi:hypothetical protein
MANRLLEKYVQVVRMDGINTNKNVTIGVNGVATNLTVSGTVTTGGVTTGSAQALTSATTIAVTPTNSVLTLVPGHSATLNFSSAASAVGQQLFLVITTSGASSYTLTFGTNTKSTGTLATGTSTGKVFVVAFVSDGTNWNEVSRTTAM